MSKGCWFFEWTTVLRFCLAISSPQITSANVFKYSQMFLRVVLIKHETKSGVKGSEAKMFDFNHWWHPRNENYIYRTKERHNKSYSVLLIKTWHFTSSRFTYGSTFLALLRTVRQSQPYDTWLETGQEIQTCNLANALLVPSIDKAHIRWYDCRHCDSLNNLTIGS